ncbi:crotonase/enoyl-CoA hydratase family protein [Sphingomonas immobilis]|uniref:Crotonase/enoyl-CoA hydratase family protein n=1 Tax=Sphingomonas immobilis TaxID=3063997 RepID=A0ABT8ZX07_9SPHN|nr:crotonase/enoyl-CoA hydratase family protein [Sphingomonas sp. CA1-15]MDO7842110.1 crotonase/enoyl-CoA hydratase family protein [Sphingomonas sp. CA1-15]
MSDRVTIALANGVADVRFNRADKLNALDQAQFEGIVAAIDTLGTMKGVRCVVLSGEGRGFCAGVDLDGLASNPALRDLMPRTHGEANLFQQIAWGWRTLPVPVIAAVHGFAFGAGFQMMLGADIRIAAPDAQLSMMEARWGLAPDVAGIALMRGLVRDDIAREITYTARKMSGTEAQALGIVTHVDADPRARAMKLAAEIAANSPQAIRAGKRLLNMTAEASAADILLAESEEQQILLDSAGHHETVAAAREKRAPVFED